jgi:hypothetical protein
MSRTVGNQGQGLISQNQISVKYEVIQLMYKPIRGLAQRPTLTSSFPPDASRLLSLSCHRRCVVEWWWCGWVGGHDAVM